MQIMLDAITVVIENTLQRQFDGRVESIMIHRGRKYFNDNLMVEWKVLWYIAIGNIAMTIWWSSRKYIIIHRRLRLMTKSQGPLPSVWVSSCNSCSRGFFRNGTATCTRRVTGAIVFTTMFKASRSGRGYYASPSGYESKDRLSKSIPLRRPKDAQRKWHDPFEMNLTRNEIITVAPLHAPHSSRIQ